MGASDLVLIAGEMKRLPNPIVSKKGWRAAFISTTLEKFRAAKELSELK